MMDQIDPFFSKSWSHSDVASEAETTALAISLPRKFDRLAQSDIQLVLSVAIFRIKTALNPIFSRDRDIELDQRLERIIKLSEELESHLLQVGETTYVNGRNFHQQWLSQLFVAKLMRTRDGIELEVPMNPGHLSGGWRTPAGAVRALKIVAEHTLRFRKRHAPKHRPNEDLLLSTVYPLVRAWAALELMEGSTLFHAFPTKRNEGLQWCCEAVDKITSGKIIGPNRLGARTKRTIGTAVGSAKVELKSTLLRWPSCDALETWKQRTWLSYSGLDLLFRAAMPAGRGWLLRDDPLIDMFDQEFLAWVRGSARTDLPEWGDDT